MISILGIDPGGTTGVALLQMRPGADGTPRYAPAKALQVKTSELGADGTMARIREEFAELWPTRLTADTMPRLILAVEAFVIGDRTVRSKHPEAGAAAREIIAHLRQLAFQSGIPMFERSASQVKPWATDNRLRAAGGATGFKTLHAATTGLPHARDAFRHALFAARHDVHWPDPLSVAYSGVDNE